MFRRQYEIRTYTQWTPGLQSDILTSQQMIKNICVCVYNIIWTQQVLFVNIYVYTNSYLLML